MLYRQMVRLTSTEVIEVEAEGEAMHVVVDVVVAFPQGKSSNWTAKQFATAGTTTNHATAFHPLRGVEPHLGRRDYTSVLGWRMGSIVVKTTKNATISLS